MKLGINVPNPIDSRKDSRNDIWEIHNPPDSSIERNDKDIKIYADYDFARMTLKQYNIVDNIEDADFLLTASHLTNFYALPMHLKLCQFPYEGGFVRKVYHYSDILLNI